MTTENKNDSVVVRKNVHNFSLFPSLLLIIQLLLLLLGVFKIEHELIAAINSFLKTSSIFLNILMGIFIIWYWIKIPVFKQKDFSRKYKVTNTFICAANIILLNKLYDNSKLNGMFKSISSLKNIEIYVFLIVVAIAVFLIARYMSKENDNEQKEKLQSINRSNKTIEAGSGNETQMPIPSNDASSIQSTGSKSNAVFTIVFCILVFLIFAAIYLVVSKFDFFTGWLNGDSSQQNFSILIAVIIAILFIIPAVIIFLIWVARSVSRFIYQMPKYMRDEKGLDDRVIKTVLGLGLIPIFVGASKLLEIDFDFLMNWLNDAPFLVAPVTLIFLIVLSMVFSNVIFGLLWGHKGISVKKDIQKIASDTIKAIVKICGNTIKSFFRLIEFIPDFLEWILILLFGKDDDKDDDKADDDKADNDDDDVDVDDSDA